MGGALIFGRSGCGPTLAAIHSRKVTSHVPVAPPLASCQRSQRASGTVAPAMVIFVIFTRPDDSVTAVVSPVKSTSSLVGAVWYVRVGAPPPTVTSLQSSHATMSSKPRRSSQVASLWLIVVTVDAPRIVIQFVRGKQNTTQIPGALADVMIRNVASKGAVADVSDHRRYRATGTLADAMSTFVVDGVMGLALAVMVLV